MERKMCSYLEQLNVDPSFLSVPKLEGRRLAATSLASWPYQAVVLPQTAPTPFAHCARPGPSSSIPLSTDCVSSEKRPCSNPTRHIPHLIFSAAPLTTRPFLCAKSDRQAHKALIVSCPEKMGERRLPPRWQYDRPSRCTKPHHECALIARPAIPNIQEATHTFPRGRLLSPSHCTQTRSSSPSPGLSTTACPLQTSQHHITQRHLVDSTGAPCRIQQSPRRVTPALPVDHDD